MQKVTEIQKPINLTELKISGLLELSTVAQSYLETHEPDTSKGCKVDINERPFDRNAYEEQRQIWYSIWVEYFRRPVEEGLDIRL
jgi:hypothetical protein